MIGFRVDANEYIATGHLMRCIAIAEQCCKMGEKCLFLLAEEKETQKLKERNLPYKVLNTKWDELEAEEAVMEQVIQEEKLNWLVVDSYQVTLSYLSFLERLVSVFYIDDMGREKYPVSALLHYDQWPDEIDYQMKYKNAKTLVLAGMQYTPLREEFADDVEKKEREHSILITTGGTDNLNITGKLLEHCVNKTEFNSYVFHVIVGSMNRNLKELERIARRHTNIILHQNVKKMSEYMRSCEIAVSAGGTTLFELCACGIPTVCFSMADNQKEFTKAMGKRKIMLYAGDARKEKEIEKEIADRLVIFMQNQELRDTYADKMRKLVDGKGTVRIAEMLVKE